MLARKKRTRAEIGAEIKRLRKECNMTQFTLGMKLHIDQAKISKLESGTDVTLDIVLLTNCVLLLTMMKQKKMPKKHIKL